MKLVIPIEEMLKQMPLPLPGWFVRFTGIVEVLGAARPNPPLAPAHPAGPDAFGRFRAGDLYDRRDGVQSSSW